MEDHRDKVLDIAVAVNRAKSLDELINEVMKRVGELLPYDRASIALVDPDSHVLRIHELTANHTNGDVAEDRGKRIPIDESNVLGWVFLHRRPHLQVEPGREQQFQAQQTGKEVQSHIIAPLVGRGQTLGLLNIGSFTAGAFSQEDVPVFTGYARLTAVAIENLRNYERARESSIRDGLTGAYNHRYFKEVMAVEANRAERYGTDFSVILLDIDHFKSFNDRFGHQAGDQILIKTVHLLESNLRPSDSVFRYGGEEFAVILPSTAGDQACVVAAKLVAVLREHNTYRQDRSTLQRITASLGVASAPDDATSRDALIACADQALYRAKNAGRDRFVSFSSITEIRKAGEDLVLSGGAVPEALFLADPGGTTPECPNQRVIQLADLLARELRLPTEQRINVRIAAFYHDIGEAGIPREILQRPGPLDARERTLVRSHPLVGETLLSRILRIGEVLQAVLHHNERFDGEGFPHRLEGKRIPLLARILSVAVVFDALISDRPYRKAYPVREAYGVLRDMAGFQLDPELVEEFVRAHGGEAGEALAGTG